MRSGRSNLNAKKTQNNDPSRFKKYFYIHRLSILHKSTFQLLGLRMNIVINAENFSQHLRDILLHARTTARDQSTCT